MYFRRERHAFRFLIFFVRPSILSFPAGPPHDNVPLPVLCLFPPFPPQLACFQPAPFFFFFFTARYGLSFFFFLVFRRPSFYPVDHAVVRISGARDRTFSRSADPWAISLLSCPSRLNLSPPPPPSWFPAPPLVCVVFTILRAASWNSLLFLAKREYVFSSPDAGTVIVYVFFSPP